MRTTIIAFVIAPIVAFVARAGADPTLATEPSVMVDAGPLPDRSGLPDNVLHFDFSAGVALGHLVAGDVTGNFGIHGAFGPRFGRVAVLIDAEIIATQARSQQASAPLGIYQRAAIEPRISVLQFRSRGLELRTPATELDRFDLWVEPGAGYEYASQVNNMPMLQRGDLSLAVGFQRTHHYASAGILGTLKDLVAEPAPGEQGRDYSLMFTSGVTFGR